MDQLHVSADARRSLAVIIGAVVLTAGFHALIYRFGSGFAFSVFGALLVAAIHVIAAVSGKRGNAWAYLFLAPLVLSLITHALYAGEASRLFAYAVFAVSLACFAFWFLSPSVRIKELPSLWPKMLFLETLIPFRSLGALFAPLSHNERRPWGRVVAGALAALPFLLILGALFMNADPLVQKTLDRLLVNLRPERVLERGIVDAIVLLFFLGAGWVALTRLTHERRPTFGETKLKYERVATATFLALLNLLFLAFIGFQFVYFFGGERFIQEQGLTYASYARNGFFQLLLVSAIVSGMVAVLYRMHALHERLIRLLSAALMLQTGVVIASAIRRMALYVDAYGLTVQRYWALAGIIFIAIGLVATLVLMFAKCSFSQWAKLIFVGGLCALSVLNVLDTEAMIARYNVDRYVEGRTTYVDAPYLLSLSADATPEIVRLLGVSSVPMIHAGSDERNEVRIMSREEVLDELKNERESLQKKFADWRNLSLSQYRALAALSFVER